MKYWLGYLTAGIIMACTWALREFAKAHSALVDMIYPYVTRMAQVFLADWSSGVDFCVWQMLLLVMVALVIGIIVLIIIFKWNPIRWLGWICAAVAVVIFLNTGLYGLNQFSGPLSEDIRLEETEFTIDELERATIYYRNEANALATQVQRNSAGNVEFAEFEQLAAQAVTGFEKLVYEESLSVFAGPMDPVKELGWSKYFTKRGITGVTVGLTGEAAVNPQTPAVMMPFAICREMARRASITIEEDASFAATYACRINDDVQFRYSGALMSYRYCLEMLDALDRVTGTNTAAEVAAGENAQLDHDLRICNKFYGTNARKDANTCDLLTSWHIQEVVLPLQVEEEAPFDPLDKSQVDLDDHPNA